MSVKTLYDYTSEFEELMDSACSALSPDAFEKFKDNIQMILSDYEE